MKKLPKDQYKDMPFFGYSDLSEEEAEYVREHKSKLLEQAQQRVGKKPTAYDLVTRAQRLCKYLSLHAPQRVILYEGRRFAQAFAIHSCAKRFSTRLCNPVTMDSYSWYDLGTGYVGFM